ncbi:MAG TPA: 3-(methylthio)propionyl-CoA ligase [Usitatibacter sp.]
MRGLMMEMPLLVSDLIRHADRHHRDTPIVSRRVEGDLHRYTYHDAHERSRRAANALGKLGLQLGDRVATLAWNGYRHFEIYYAVAGSGMVMHTVNPRLFPEQIAWILNDAKDKVLFLDLTFLPLVQKILPLCKHLKHLVLMTDRAHMPAGAEGFLCYEDLLAAESDAFEWPTFDENTACGLCYTSGTTGNPKGALYSHRSTVLHAYAICLPDAMCLSASDSALPVVPMFHANAWGLPFAAPLVGAKLVFPGAALDGKSLHALFESERVSFSAGVPTVWGGLIQYMRENRVRLTTLKRTIIGGAPCPPAMIRALEDEFGIEVNHAWGMTEMSPLGSVCKVKEKHLSLPPEEQRAIREKQGRVVFGVDWKIVDGEGKDLPWDGVAFGDLLVRGPWVVSGYYEAAQSPLIDGWFPTGDVATIDADGFLRITDRSKDVVKSGGEWISSIALENIAMAHPAVLEAAVIACRHPKWDERPLLIAVVRAGQQLTREELLAFYDGKVAKWWIPDDVVFVPELPHTATGKLLKTTLRDQYRDHPLPAATAAGSGKVVA